MKFASVIVPLLLFGALAPRVACDEIRIDHRTGTTGNYSPVRLTTTPNYVLTFDAGGVPIIAAPSGGGGGIAVGDSPTWTGAHTFSKAGAASAPTISLTGAPFTGGDATTTKPLLLVEPTGTTSTGWNTAGTAVGVNAGAGFAGNLIDAQVAGITRMAVRGDGYLSLSAAVLAGNNPVLGAAAVMGSAGAGGTAGGLSLSLGNEIGWVPGNQAFMASDLLLGRLGPANLRLGRVPSATPLAQTFTIGEASRPGTDSNVAGANGTIQSGLGTGTGTASQLIFQTPTLSTGSAAQTYATRLILDTTGATVEGSMNSSVNVRAGTGSWFYWFSRASMQSPADGIIQLGDSAGTNFSRLQLGGTTASFPALKRSGAGIAIRLADDSANAAITAGAATFSGNVTAAASTTWDLSAANVLLGTATGLPVEFCVAMSDETTAITTGTAKVTMRAPYAFTVTSLRASVNTVSSSGIPTVDVNEAGTSIISTKLTIDASEKTSVTAAAAHVISDSAIADDAELTFDIDVSGTGAKGLKVWVYGNR